MKLFSEFAYEEEMYLSEEKNTHMTHLENSVIYGGVAGAKQAIDALRDVRDMLSGKKASSISTKWDGAPAIFAGTDPSDGRFFVAKKGIFNKNPMVYKTAEEVDADTSGDLAVKLKLALKHLPSLGIKGVVQGDFLYARKDLKTETINGQKYLTFHPNTIVYAIPAASQLAKTLKRSKIGIVWHTSYTGNSFETMKAQYGKPVNIKSTTDVWSNDAFVQDASAATLSSAETKRVNELISEIGRVFNTVAGDTLRALEKNPELQRDIETYDNRFVRAQTRFMTPKKRTEGLIKFIQAKYKKEIDKRKTEKGKNVQVQKLQAHLDFFSPAHRKSLENMFTLQVLMIKAKILLVRKLNQISELDTFVRTKDGFRVTSPEGFVAVDSLGGNAVKLVDRMEFSYTNFSPDVVKGWQRLK